MPRCKSDTTTIYENGATYGVCRNCGHREEIKVQRVGKLRKEQPRPVSGRWAEQIIGG